MIEISNDRLANATRTKDAVAAFKTAVDNGQARLALDILGDMLPTLISKIEQINAIEAPQPKQSIETKEENQQKSHPAKSQKETKASKDADETDA